MGSPLLQAESKLGGGAGAERKGQAGAVYRFSDRGSLADVVWRSLQARRQRGVRRVAARVSSRRTKPLLSRSIRVRLTIGPLYWCLADLPTVLDQWPFLTRLHVQGKGGSHGFDLAKGSGVLDDDDVRMVSHYSLDPMRRMRCRASCCAWWRLAVPFGPPHIGCSVQSACHRSALAPASVSLTQARAHASGAVRAGGRHGAPGRVHRGPRAIAVPGESLSWLVDQ